MNRFLTILWFIQFAIAFGDNIYVLRPKPNVINIRTGHFVPENWTWGNVDGTNYLTKVTDQNRPISCGSCWAHAVVNMISDRLKILRINKATVDPDELDDIHLSPQFLLNCGDPDLLGCDGGHVSNAILLIWNMGFIPFEECLPYHGCSQNHNHIECKDSDWTCKPVNICRKCKNLGAISVCEAMEPFPNATIKDFGMVSGVDDMKLEIYMRGPITCDINAYMLDNYVHGAIDNSTLPEDTNHAVTIVGWNNGNWIARNTWGENWGENGYFRVKMGENQMLIESNCYWVVLDSWSEL
jgi:cathepsin X